MDILVSWFGFVKRHRYSHWINKSVNKHQSYIKYLLPNTLHRGLCALECNCGEPII